MLNQPFHFIRENEALKASISVDDLLFAVIIILYSIYSIHYGNFFLLLAGGSQSTLQDIKVPERAGGYSYQSAENLATRNRFIYWRIAHDVLELSEHSLDINLTNNQVKYRFTDTPVLDSISIHETDDMVLILVATVSSVHKLSFPHPVIMQKQVVV